MPMPYWNRKRKAPCRIELSDDESDTEEPASKIVKQSPSDPLTSKSVLKLRTYQEDAVHAVLQALKDGLTRVGVSAPTASGKTVIFMALMPLVPVPKDRENAEKILILTNSVTLCHQTRKEVLKTYGKKYNVGLQQGQSTVTEYDDVIVATYQSIWRDKALSLYKPEEFKMVIVDEAHHAPADTFLRILHHFNDEVEIKYGKGPLTELDHGHKVPIIGFSATLHRTDKRELGWSFQEVVYHLSMEEMLSKAYVAPIEIKSGHEDVFNLWDRLHGLNVAQNAQSDKEARPSVAPASVPPWLEKKDADQLVKARSHTRLKKMSELVDATDFYKTVVEMYKEHAKDRRSTLVFCSRIKMVAGMVKGFNDAGVKAQVISATTRPVQREAILSSFKRAEYPVLINCQVLTQGFDMPEIDCIIMARPTESRIDFTQMIGRGTRLSPGTNKKGCLILDLFGICSRFTVAVEPCLNLTKKQDTAKQKDTVKQKETVEKKVTQKEKQKQQDYWAKE